MPFLGPGDSFPPLILTRPGGQTLALPQDFAGSFGVVLFYRGSRCRHCLRLLRAFQKSRRQLAKAGIKVGAISSDDECTTAEFIAKHALTFAIGHSADAVAISQTTGAWADLEPPSLRSAAFVLDPSGKVLVSTYSSEASDSSCQRKPSHWPGARFARWTSRANRSLQGPVTDVCE